MRKVKVKELTEAAFRPYGEFFSVLEPKGFDLDNFYADRVSFPAAGDVPLGFFSSEGGEAGENDCFHGGISQ